MLNVIIERIIICHHGACKSIPKIDQLFSNCVDDFTFSLTHAKHTREFLVCVFMITEMVKVKSTLYTSFFWFSLLRTCRKI